MHYWSAFLLNAFILWVFFIGPLVFSAQAEKALPIAVVNENNYLAYQQLVRDNGGNPLKITHFESPRYSRVIVDIILMQQALDLGGCKVSIKFMTVPTPSRAVLLVKSGQVAMMANDIWSTAFDATVFKSGALFEPGDFKKFIYGRKDNKRLMAASHLTDLQSLSVVTGHDWSVDIATLEDMGMSKIVKVADYDLQMEMVKAGRVDFGLLELPYLDSFEKMQDQRLGVVQGVLVGLKGTRHFMVSKIHPQGKRAYQSLEKGLGILKDQGRIKKAMGQVGMYSRQVSGWQMVYP